MCAARAAVRCAGFFAQDVVAWEGFCDLLFYERFGCLVEFCDHVFVAFKVGFYRFVKIFHDHATCFVCGRNCKL